MTSAAPSPPAPTALQLVQSNSLPALVHAEIEQLILRGEFAVGQRVTETELAARFGTSRGPIREALRTLEESRLVRSEKHRGVFVREISVAEADEIYDVREALDELIGRRVAERASPQQLRELTAVVAEMDAAAGLEDVKTYHELNLRFHDLLVDFAGNARLTESYRLLTKGLLLFRMRRFGEAMTLLKQIEAQEPQFSSSHFYLAAVYLSMKDYPAYLADMRELYTLTQDSQGLAVAAAGEKGLAAGGYEGMFEGILAVERQLYAKDRLPAYALAETYGRLGRKAETLTWLRRALERMEPAMVPLRVDEALDCVRGDAAYREIVRRFDLGAHR